MIIVFSRSFFQQIKRKASALQRLAVDLPQQFQNEVKHANTVIQRHKHLFASQSNSLTTLQDQLSQLQETLQDVTDRHAKEKKRRQELHNILMVNTGLDKQNFQRRIVNIFLPINFSICFGCSREPSH